MRMRGIPLRLRVGNDQCWPSSFSFAFRVRRLELDEVFVSTLVLVRLCPFVFAVGGVGLSATGWVVGETSIAWRTRSLSKVELSLIISINLTWTSCFGDERERH
jgi:hypothetical protein